MRVVWKIGKFQWKKFCWNVYLSWAIFIETCKYLCDGGIPLKFVFFERISSWFQLDFHFGWYLWKSILLAVSIKTLLLVHIVRMLIKIRGTGYSDQNIILTMKITVTECGLNKTWLDLQFSSVMWNWYVPTYTFNGSYVPPNQMTRLSLM